VTGGGVRTLIVPQCSGISEQGKDIVTPSGNQLENREHKHEPKFRETPHEKQEKQTSE
jgi:hypothetical protein